MSHIFKDWVYSQHRAINHMYNKGDIPLPYEFHLQLTEQVANDYTEVMDELNIDLHVGRAGCQCHDLLEDVPSLVSYNDLYKFACTCFEPKKARQIAEIAFACWDNRGRNRHEKHEGDYFRVLITVHGALFVKLCDRIANMRFSKMMRSSQMEMYRKELDAFLIQTNLHGIDTDNPYFPMVQEMRELANETK